MRGLVIPTPVRRPLGRFQRHVRRRAQAAQRRVDLTVTRYRRRSQAFTWQGMTYGYASHLYNRAWQNERSVEIPIGWSAVRDAQQAGARILEVGNTLSHYYPVRHDIVDLHEVAPGVINTDILDYRAAPYDLIVSISTVEHIGYNAARSTVDPAFRRTDADTDPPEKLLAAFAHLRSLLTPTGRAVVTMPLGYNPFLDTTLANGALPADRVTFLQRVTADNQWREACWTDVAGSRYDAPWPWANALVIAELNAP